MSVPDPKIIQLFPDDTNSVHMNSRTNEQVVKNDNSLIINNQELKKRKKRKKKKKQENNSKDDVIIEKKKKKGTRKKSSNKMKTDNELEKTEKVEEISEKKNLEFNEENILVSRSKRFLIFILIVLINIIVNLDHGTIPAATEVLKESLDIGEMELGFFGTLLYTGNAIGKNNFYIYLIL